MQWTREQDALLAQLWDTGQSGSQIGKQLGVSRCSILGRARRIGLSPRISEESKASTTPRRKAPKFNFATVSAKSKPRPALAPEPFVYRETVVTPEDSRLNFEALEPFDRKCRYAHGEAPPYTFCGAPTIAGTSWCAVHFEVVTGAPHPTQVFREASKNPEPENMGKSHILEAVS